MAEHVLVVGGGTMGRGIAGLCALSGYDTWVFDADPAAQRAVRPAIEASWGRAIDKGKLTTRGGRGGAPPAEDGRAAARRARRRLRDRGGAGGARPEAHGLLASSTTSARRGRSSPRTRRRCSIARDRPRDRPPGPRHRDPLLQPVAAMPLVEIVRGPETSAETEERAARARRGRSARRPSGSSTRRDSRPRASAWRSGSRPCGWSRRASRARATSTARWSSATGTGWAR